MAVLRYRNGNEWVLLGLGPAGDPGPDGDPGAPGTDGAGFTQAAGDALYLPITGGTMTGPLNMGGNPITGAPDGVADNDPATVGQLPTQLDPPVQVQAAVPAVRRGGDIWIDSDPPVQTFDDPGIWQRPVLGGGWVDYDAVGTTHAQARYRRTASGYVEVQGLIKSGTTKSTIFTLPAGYRPGSHYIFHVAANASVAPGGARIDVFNDGRVYLDAFYFSGNNGWLSLCGIGFMAGG